MTQTLADTAADLAFLSHLDAARTAVAAGFQFEEGGCFALALALHDMARHCGYQPRLVIDTGFFVHAYMELDGVLYDHLGASRATVDANPELIRLPVPAFLDAVRQYGHTDPAAFGADYDAAFALIRAAVELARHPDYKDAADQAENADQFEAALQIGLRHLDEDDLWGQRYCFPYDWASGEQVLTDAQRRNHFPYNDTFAASANPAARLSI